MHCNHFLEKPISRREMLLQCANGFGAIAFAALFSSQADASASPKSPHLTPHFPARARSVIFLFMDGGPSQVDTFDPKERLIREHGQPIKMARIPATQFDNVGNVLKSPWEFRRYGESGIPVSDLFPHVGTWADDLCVIRSMVAEHSEHTNANYFIHTGFGMQGRPSMGAWASYGLGSECRDLPGFIVLNSGLIPPGGLDCFGSGYLPAAYQGSLFRSVGEAVADIRPPVPERPAVRKLDLLRKLDHGVLGKMENESAVESAIGNYELAFRMQAAVPDLLDFSGESALTQKLYGIDEKHTEVFGRQCLLARRLVERGVRFVELLCPRQDSDRWDQHSDLKKGHEINASAVDKPIAGLLKDLKARGMLDSTLVIWGGEFGRTPMAQGTDGRDHNPFGFSIWLAGGGVKGGHIHGATDDYGYFAVENKVTIHDLHATMLHLMGMDHTKLTYRFSGRDMRLTDVHGAVIREILS